ncbi:P-loop containing nucleoside triphosphate hydrolase protein [Ceratobasidium sp. AG-I]|nr:P-loop containing nucleoside triphosphate hydrolase protein [Ceratobasidium sp. AG-I]
MAHHGDITAYVLKNKDVVQTHMERHKQTWTEKPTLISDISSPIRVFIRVRPILPPDNSFSLIYVQPPRTIHFTHPTHRWAGGRFATKTYDSDGVFDVEASNEDVFVGMGVDVGVGECVRESGREFCVLAYGQTGTGKTFSMTGIEERIGSTIFNALPQDEPPSVTISVFEIRGSNAYDLLSEPVLHPVKILSSGSDVIYSGVTTHSVRSPEELRQFVDSAKESRLTRSTVKNDTSSRSHAIFRITITYQDPQTPSSNIYIVDLAGSERSNISQKNNSERFKESVETNKSLSVLKDCIRAKLSPSISVQHIPWRGSKLTMALKRAFDVGGSGDGARSKLVVLACVSPSVVDAEDTHGTLKYVTPFQMSASMLVDGMTTGGNSGNQYDTTILSWTHEESIDYIKRNCGKFTPLIPRLFPTPETTLTDLISLSLPDLATRITTPRPDEPPNAVDSRALNQAKSWIPTYHKKLHDLANRQSKGRGAELLEALSGRDVGANETGVVTRFDLTGAVQVIEAGNGDAEMKPVNLR